VFAFDYFGRRVRFGYDYEDEPEIIRILELFPSGASDGDEYLVELPGGLVSWAELQRTFSYGMMLTQKPGEFLPPAGFGMDIWLRPIGQVCEAIEPLPEGMLIGHFASYVGRSGEKFYFLERGTGDVIDFSVEGKNKRVKEFCAQPICEGRKAFVRFLRDGEETSAVIDMDYCDGCRLQLLK
jgi:hypothetical protein